MAALGWKFVQNKKIPLLEPHQFTIKEVDVKWTDYPSCYISWWCLGLFTRWCNVHEDASSREGMAARIIMKVLTLHIVNIPGPEMKLLNLALMSTKCVQSSLQKEVVRIKMRSKFWHDDLGLSESQLMITHKEGTSDKTSTRHGLEK